MCDLIRGVSRVTRSSRRCLEIRRLELLTFLRLMLMTKK